MSAALTSAADSFRGIWPALSTPLEHDLRINHAKFARHALGLLGAGCAGVTPFGTTGEGPSFSVAERIEAVDQLIAAGVPAQRMIVSALCSAVPDALALTRHALERGAHGVMMLPPFFFKAVGDQAVVDAYSQLITAVGSDDWRLYLYHIPQVASVSLSHAAISELLARHGRVIRGIKDSGCDQAFSVSLARAFMPRITVYVGNEPDLRVMGRLGSTGAISGLANLAPRGVHRLVMAPDAPDTDAVEGPTLALLRILQRHSLLSAFKAGLALRDRDPTWLRVRPTLEPVSGASLGALETAMRDADLLRNDL